MKLDCDMSLDEVVASNTLAFDGCGVIVRCAPNGLRYKVAELNPSGDRMAPAYIQLFCLSPKLLVAVQDLLSLTETYAVGQNSAIVDRARQLVADLNFK